MGELLFLMTLVATITVGGLSSYAMAARVAFPACCDYSDGSGSICAKCRTPECCQRACNAYCTNHADNVNCNAGC